MSYELINTLCESRVFRTKESTKVYTKEDTIDFFYTYLLATIILASEKQTALWAREYISKTSAFANFNTFRTTGTDLYVLAYMVNTHNSDDLVNERLRLTLRRIAQGTISATEVESYLMRIERFLGIKNARLRMIRRNATRWAQTNLSNRISNLNLLHRMIRLRSLRSEILPQIDSIIKGRASSPAGLGTMAAATIAAGAAGLLLGLRHDPNKRIEFVKRLGEGMENLNEERPTQLFNIVAELEKNPMIEEVISVNYIADGIAAFVRTTDGNAYEFQIRAAPDAHGFEKERGIK